MTLPPEFTLHCDDCHHEVDIQGKMTAEHVGTPCPVCGSDMLTEADYRVGRRFQFVLAILTFLGLAKPAPRGRQEVPGYERIQFRGRHGKIEAQRR